MKALDRKSISTKLGSTKIHVLNNAGQTIGLRTKTGKGGRFIIVHAGSSDGFVPGALLMFRFKFGNEGDYHDSMNSQTYKKWFEEQLLPNIPQRSLMIMDNAPYHNMQVNKAPSSNSRKGDIIKWLIYNDIQHDSSHTRSELLQLVKQHKQNLLRYEIDELAVANGHKVLRLPPYYCRFNPIELIWAQVKDEIKKRKIQIPSNILRKLNSLLCRLLIILHQIIGKNALTIQKRLKKIIEEKTLLSNTWCIHFASS